MTAGVPPTHDRSSLYVQAVRSVCDDEDPYAFVGDSPENVRLVRLLDQRYIDNPNLLGSFWVPGVRMEDWMFPMLEKPAVAAKKVKELWEQGYYAVPRVSHFFPERGSFFVIEQDKLLVPEKETARMKEDGVSIDELKALQGQLSFQAAQASGMPYTLAVHSGSKSVHYYIKPADPENWPLRPMQGCSNNSLLPDVLKNIGKERLTLDRREEREGKHEPYYRMTEMMRLALGDVDMAVLHASGRNGQTRIPFGMRDNGVEQSLLGIGKPVLWADFYKWLTSQLSEEALAWVTDPHRNAARDAKKTSKVIKNLLRIQGPQNWQGMVARRVSPDGTEREMTTHWASVTHELYATQKEPEIIRQPNWEAGDWGEINASYMWWFSALTVNALSLPLVADHPEAPVPYGWFFTGNQWWWEDDKGNPNKIRDQWSPGNEGTFEERIGIGKKPTEFLADLWEKCVDEEQRKVDEWKASGKDWRSAPSFGVGDQKQKLTKQETPQHNAQDNLNERAALFVERLGSIVKRTTENTIPYQSVWMAYDGKVWQPLAIEIVHAAAVTALNVHPIVNDKGIPKEITPRVVADFVHYCHSDETSNILYRGKKWEQKETCTVFNNGTLYVDGSHIEFKENHWNPDDLATTMLSYDYDPSVATPLFDRMMKSMFPFDQDRELLLQFMGYLYDPRNDQKKFALIKGGADTGKTTLQTILTAIVGGDEHVMSPSLTSMTGDKHWAANLPNTRLIAIDEQTDTPMRMTKQAAALFKQLTGDGTIEVRQMRKEGFNVQVKAKMVVTTNNEPNFSDDSSAFWNRCLYFQPSLADKKDRVPYLAEKIIKNELPGVAAKLAEALRRLKSKGQFDIHPEMTIRVEEFREANSPLMEFWADWMIPTDDPNEYCYAKSIMAVMQQERGQSWRMSERKFIASLKSSFPNMSTSRIEKTKIGDKVIHHMPPLDNITNSFFTLKGYRCTHPRADAVIAPPAFPREDAGTINDPTKLGNVVSFPGRVMQ